MGEVAVQQLGNILLGERGRMNSGHLKIHQGGFVWKKAGGGKVVKVSKVDLSKLNWMRVPKGYQLGIWLKAGSNVKFHGFREQLTKRVLAAQVFQEPVHDEEWERQRLEESKQLQRRRKEEAREEQMKVEEYRQHAKKLQNFPAEGVKKAKRFVASLIQAGEEVEEMIVEAAQNGDLSPMVLLVIRNRLELAQRDEERDAMQALDLLYRRIEKEMLQKEASLELQFLNELLNLHDGFSHEEWLQRARRCMLEIFVPENAFTILAPPDFDPTNKMGPTDIPEQDDALLRVDFLREVDQLLKELESQPEIKTVEGSDAQSIAVRLRLDEKKRALQYVKDLQHLAATLKW